jgi:hypothetical protein
MQNPSFRPRNEIGLDLGSVTNGAHDVERIIEHARWCSLETDVRRISLAQTEEIAALMAGAAALLRETAAKMSALSDELQERPSDAVGA